MEFSFEQGILSEIADEASLALACPGYEVEIVSLESSQRVAGGEVGELRIRGPGVAAGYALARDDERRAFRDGWYYTGDLVCRSGTGDIFFVSRRNDMVKQQGFRVYPAEVETIIRSHPDIEDVCVFPVMDDEYGESIAAAVVPVAGGCISVRRLLAFCRERMPAYKVPRMIETLPSLPRTQARKVDRLVLAKQLQRRSKTVKARPG